MNLNYYLYSCLRLLVFDLLLNVYVSFLRLVDLFSVVD